MSLESAKVHPAKHFRQRHRQQQHATAHSESAVDAARTGPDIAGTPNGRAELVTDSSHLLQVVERLRATGRFAYDTEFIGELSYRPQLCLIQVGTADQVWLIDPLAGVSLDPLWELLCDASVRKLVHAGDQDLEHVWRAVDRAPQNILDTQIASGFVGLSYPAALSKLVLEFTGVRLHKAFTFTDWSHRPLSGSQLRYAADDVRFLPLLADKIETLLAERGRSDWARAECDARCVSTQPNADPNQSWERVRGSASLDARGLRVLQALAAWREGAAQSSDVPARTFVKDEVLIDLSRQPPKSIDRLYNVKHMPRPVVEHHGATIVDAVQRALASKDGPQVVDSGPDPLLRDKFRHDSLWAAAQAFCCGQGLDPQLVTSKQEIIDFDRDLRTGPSIEAQRLMTGWRREALGEKLVELIRNDARTTLSWNSDGLQLA
jgi:ribonuclease D